MKPPPPSQAQIEEHVTSFIKNFKAPGPIFSPVPICEMSMDNYINLFSNVDGKCGAKISYKDGVLYLLDNLSFLHAKVLGLITGAIFVENPYLRNYFDCGGSYTIQSGSITFEPDLLLSIDPEHFCGPFLDNGVVPPSLIVEVAISQDYFSAVSKCRTYYGKFDVPIFIVLSSRNLFKKRTLTIMYSELGEIKQEQEIPINGDFTLHIPMTLLTNNMLLESRKTLLNQSDKLTIHLESKFLSRLIPK